MLTASVVLTVLLVASVSCHGPPGVPPRQGGGPPPGTHGGQQQFQQQQPPQQQQYQQQPPQQQQYQQQPPQQQQYQQQPPQQQQYQQQFQQQHPEVVEGHAHERGKNFKFQSEIHNADHILEHLQNVIKTKPKDQMSEEELEFHYFKMHDYDNNNKLDGVEIGKALTHFHDDHEPPSEQDGAAPSGEDSSDTNNPDNPPPVGDHHANQTPTQPPPGKGVSDEEISSLVDIVLTSYDKNDDGYVEYFEYKQAKG